jgi:predicted RNA-binding protein with PUA domain
LIIFKFIILRRAFEFYKADFIKCNYRLTQEGAHQLHSYMNDSRKLVVNRTDFLKFICQNITRIDDFTDGKIQQKAKNFEPGSCVVIYHPENQARPYAVSALKTVQNLMRHVKKEDAKVIALELTDDPNVEVN